MDDNKPTGQFPLPGIALVLLALGIFVAADNPFNPTRPDVSTDLTATAEDVRARLWQDPFEAVEAHKKANHKEYVSSVSNKNTSAYFNNKIYQDPQHRICNPDTSSIKEELYAHTFGELECQINKDVKSKVHILTVMVPGSIYAEDHETRIRSRYALVTALSKAGYIPRDSEHIGYMDFSGLCKSALKKGLTTVSRDNNADIKYCDWPATIPYEWFKLENKDIGGPTEKSVLVLWLDESNIAQNKPLTMLNRLRKSITPREDNTRQYTDNDKKVTYDVIGPATSTILVQMLKEVIVASCDGGKGCNTGLKTDFKKHNIRMFSPRATIDDGAIDKNLGVSFNVTDEDKSWFNLQRTIPDDSELVKSLLCELIHRGINPYEINSTATISGCHQANDIKLNKLGTQDHIVLIGEWDTVYSRNFHELFEKNIRKNSESENINWLHSYNYLRGIDGATAKSADKINNKGKGDAKNNNKAIRRPVGENQYDYLRRIGDQISDLPNNILNGGTIKAIGIVGSDAYDKLLVLQALRSRFPDVIFFTTDIDVRMLHKEENKWARNLVVAAGHGLSPKETSGKEIITFRDGYQTSLYLSVLKAIGYIAEGAANTNQADYDVFGHKISAKIFEIGNDRAVEYSHDAQSKIAFLDFLSSNYIYIILFLFLLFLLLYQASYTSRVITLTGTLIITVVGILVMLTGAVNSVEFKVFFTGTSIWPSIVIRMFAAVLALAFIVYALKALKGNINEIISEYNFKCGDKSFSQDFKTKIFLENWVPGTNEICISDLLYQYLDIAKTTCWFGRVFIMSAVYFSITYVFLFSFPSLPFNPFHGADSGRASFLVIISCVFLYVFLIFLVVDVTRLYARFVKLLSKSNVTWPEEVTEPYCKDYGLTKAVATQKLKLDLIVKRSKVVDKLIFLPFIILSLMIVSRSEYFDHWHMPLQLAFVILLGACIAISSAIRLRRTAEDARKLALNSLTDAYKKQLYKESVLERAEKEPDAAAGDESAVDVTGKVPDNTESDENVTDVAGNKPATAIHGFEDVTCEYKMAERIKVMLDEIRNIKDGPFVPISHHPIITAIAMPFGGVGGLYVIDYLTNVGI